MSEKSPFLRRLEASRKPTLEVPPRKFTADEIQKAREEYSRSLAERDEREAFRQSVRDQKNRADKLGAGTKPEDVFGDNGAGLIADFLRFMREANGTYRHATQITRPKLKLLGHFSSYPMDRRYREVHRGIIGYVIGTMNSSDMPRVSDSYFGKQETGQFGFYERKHEVVVCTDALLRTATARSLPLNLTDGKPLPVHTTIVEFYEGTPYEDTSDIWAGKLSHHGNSESTARSNSYVTKVVSLEHVLETIATHGSNRINC